MPMNYKLVFWDLSAPNIDAELRGKVALAALTLQEDEDVTYAGSGGGHDVKDPFEIALLVHVDYSARTFQPAVERALRDEGAAVKATLKNDVRFYDLSAKALDAIEKSKYEKSFATLDDTKRQTDREQIMRLFTTPPPADPVAPPPTTQPQLNTTSDAESTQKPLPPAEIPLGSKLPPLSVTRDKYTRLRNARDEAVKQELQDITDAICRLAVERKTTAMVFQMIASGLISLGEAMWTQYEKLEAAPDLPTLLSCLITRLGGPAAVAHALESAAIIFTEILNPLKLAAANCLIVVNGTSFGIIKGKHYILNGDPGAPGGATTSVSKTPDAKDKPMAYPCGLCICDEGEPVEGAYHGSTIGVEYQLTAESNDGQFSVGMNCPNNTSGETNGVAVKDGLNGMGAAKTAERRGKGSDSVKCGDEACTISRADPSGSTNWCICWIGPPQ